MVIALLIVLALTWLMGAITAVSTTFSRDELSWSDFWILILAWPILSAVVFAQVGVERIGGKIRRWRNAR